MYAGRIAAGTQSFEASDLRALDFFVDAQGGDRAFFLSNEVVDADDDLLFFLDGALKFERHFLDFSLNKTGFDGAQHSSERVDLGDVLFGAAFDFVGEMFDGVRTRDGIDGVGDTRFVRDDLLRAQGNEGGVFGR